MRPPNDIPPLYATAAPRELIAQLGYTDVYRVGTFKGKRIMLVIPSRAWIIWYDNDLHVAETDFVTSPYRDAVKAIVMMHGFPERQR